jgi:holin-like protein
MIKGFAILLSFQAIGELLVVLLRLPVSGPICGMALLLYWLNQSGTEASKDLTATADGLLSNMAVLFVPIGVGVMAYGELLKQDWLAIGVALVVSTFLSVAATAGVVGWVKRQQAKHLETGDMQGELPSGMAALVSIKSESLRAK